MGKRLVSEKNVEELICRSTSKVYVDNTMILTPGAKDRLAEKRVALVYGPAPEKNTERVSAGESLKDKGCGPEEILIAVASVLKSEYGITDPDQLVDISCKVVNIIKENI